MHKLRLIIFITELHHIFQNICTRVLFSSLFAATASTTFSTFFYHAFYPLAYFFSVCFILRSSMSLISLLFVFIMIIVEGLRAFSLVLQKLFQNFLSIFFHLFELGIRFHIGISIRLRNLWQLSQMFFTEPTDNSNLVLSYQCQIFNRKLCQNLTICIQLILARQMLKLELNSFLQFLCWSCNIVLKDIYIQNKLLNCESSPK